MPELGLMLDKFRQALEARGGDRVIGRKLPRILKDAGFQNVDLDAILFHSDESSLDDFFFMLDPEMFSRLMVGDGLLTEKQVDDYKRAIETFKASPNALILTIWLMACGEKM